MFYKDGALAKLERDLENAKYRRDCTSDPIEYLRRQAIVDKAEDELRYEEAYTARTGIWRV